MYPGHHKELFISRVQSRNYISALFFIFILLASHVNGELYAGDKEVIPNNARSNTYGSGWECLFGYQLKGKECIAINMPENAYLTHSSFGNGWKCSWGFHKINNACISIKIPENAFLNSYGYGWECKRGFKASNNACIAVTVPENGYLVNSTFGEGWECERGYLAKQDFCVKLNVPANAHIDYSGSHWECNPPYSKRLDKCELPMSNYMRKLLKNKF